ncbi:GatB/YqeY domain-containing protein [Kibdelosporangium persicum]|uniref:GatB/YqeY domain-containing protein n=1 Tax=Kibdelosporangium persicum TaxID=2698649 RepID=A0ABX2FJ76_9PSEU|nr:GatB/YqeY domain-containing protein [Kibdelosporangium persicum]NRN70816.1 hypothetical protein [Kibdelosporangium persicum]
MRTTLRRDLTEAIKARNRVAISALRSALAAIENAEAPPMDDHPKEMMAAGAGSTEIERRHLTDADLYAIVASEVEQRSAAADQYDKLGREDVAARLRAEADVLRHHLTAAQ